MVGCRRTGNQGFINMEIELAKSTIGRIRQKQRVKRLLDKVAIWGALFLGLVMILIAGINLWLNRENQVLDRQIKSTQKQIETKAKVESQQVYLNSKLTTFAGLIKTHERHQQIAETVFSLIPNGTSLKGFEVSEAGTINLSGSVSSWPLFSRLLSNLQQPSQPLSVAQAKIKQVNFTGDGTVSFDIELTLKL